jgi:dUTP pyrophosphatase
MLPTKPTLEAAGYDIFGCEAGVIPARGRRVFNTGIITIPPNDCYLRIAPRSGLALKHGIDVLAGVVDSDYRGEIKVILFNTSHEDYQVNVGDKIAQLICERIYFPTIRVISCEHLSHTQRNECAFGSSGYK